ncbi:MAG: ArdC family protein [Phycisphaerae bacterium]
MKIDAYDKITSRVIELLEQGTVPWHKTWTGDSMPRNAVSNKSYRGMNVFLLMAAGYTSPYWLTYKQATELGGCVRKGEKAMPVVFWKRIMVEDKDDPDNTKCVPLLRYYSVFNVDQCNDIDMPTTETPKREHNPIQDAEAIVAGMPNRPEIRHGGGRACYRPSLDMVSMPPADRFETGSAYYNVLFHELTHATGHKDRLNRNGCIEGAAFGSHTYSREELVAEMGAAFLCGHAGLLTATIDNSAAYIANWLERLRNDRKLVVTAAAQAQKASDFILDVQFEN